MAKTRIEWCNFSVNPVKGLCPMNCKDNQGKPYCYARRLYKRFKWYEGIEWDESCLHALRKIKSPSRIFVGSTMELFGEWVHKWALESIFSYCRNYPQHTFIFLTKQPQNLPRAWPDNCWVGVSAPNFEQFAIGLTHLHDVKPIVKFFSFEPLLHEIAPEKKYAGYNSDLMALDLKHTGINWVIIGQQTPVNKRTEPKIAWIQEILVASHNAGNIPVFIKDNLRPLLERECPGWAIRQEFPKQG